MKHLFKLVFLSNDTAINITRRREVNSNTGNFKKILDEEFFKGRFTLNRFWGYEYNRKAVQKKNRVLRKLTKSIKISQRDLN